MKKDQLAFLLAGIAFGVLVGYGFFNAFANRPGAARAPAEQATGPMGPPAMSQGPPPGDAGGGGSAPMLQEINALKQAVETDPSNLPAWIRLANIYHDAGMFEPAIGFYEKAIALSPSDPDLITDMGICYEQLRQYPKALELFEQAQSIDSTHWQSLYNIVVVSTFGLVDYDRADATLKRLESVNPSAPNLQQMREAITRGRAQRAPQAGS